MLLLIIMCIYYFKYQCLREKENVQSSHWFQNKSIWTFYIFNFIFLVSRNIFSVCVPRMQNSFMLHNGTLTLHSLNAQRCMWNSRNSPPKSKHAHILQNVNNLQLYRMSQVSQNICKTSPSFSKSVGGNAAPSYVVLSKNWWVCSHCLPHLLLLSISHLSCCLRPGGTAVPPPAHTGGPAAAAAAAAAAKRRWAQRAQTWLCNHISDKHSSGFACFNPFATNYIVYIADKRFCKHWWWFKKFHVSFGFY